MSTIKNTRGGGEFMALVAPRATIKRRRLQHADLHRLRNAIGANMKAGTTTNGDFILYSTDLATWRKLVGILPFLTEFREQRIDPMRIEINLLEIVDKDDPIFA